MKYQKSILCLLILIITTASFAQEATKLVEKGTAAYQKKEYKKSADFYAKALEKGIDEPGVAYNAACSFALANDKENAFKFLKMSVDMGYQNARHMKSDKDLNSLHSDSRWKEIVEFLEVKRKAYEEFWDHPKLKTPYKENISEDEKIAGLAKVWSEVKYNFANFDLVPDVKWDALFVEYIPKVKQTKSTFEYYKVLVKMIAKLRDGHSNVYFPSELTTKAYSIPLLETGLIENKVWVTSVDGKEIEEAGIKVGQQVTAIDGTPVKEYAEKKVMPYQSASTKQDLLDRTYYRGLLRGEENKPVKLTLVDKNGKSFEREVQRHYKNFRALYTGKAFKPFEFKMLKNNIGYVALNTFGNNKPLEEFEAKFNEIAKTDALIIDIRRNGGGNSNVGWRILGMLTDKPSEASSWNTREYRPSFRAWGRPEKRYQGGKYMIQPHGEKLYKKPVIVLTGPSTFSAAEDFAVAFDVMERGLIIGEPTGGSTGQPLFFRLPGGGSGRVTSKRDKYPDGKKEFVGVGVLPNKNVSPTIKDLRMGKDTVLEAAKLELAKIAKK